MIPEIGSKWISRDGRIMRVVAVDIPEDAAIMPVARLEVLSIATPQTRRVTKMHTGRFDPGGFMRPARDLELE